MKLKPIMRLTITPLSLILLLSLSQDNYGMESGITGAAKQFANNRRAKAAAKRAAAAANAATASAERTPATAALASAIGAAATRTPATTPLPADSIILVTDASRALTVAEPILVATTESFGETPSASAAPVAIPCVETGTRRYADVVTGADMPILGQSLVITIPTAPLATRAGEPTSPRATADGATPPRRPEMHAANFAEEDTCGISGKAGLFRWVGATIASAVIDITPTAYIRTTGLDPKTTRYDDVEADLLYNINIKNSENVKLLAKWLADNPRFKINKTVLARADEYITTEMDKQRHAMTTKKVNFQAEIRRQLAAQNSTAITELTSDAAAALALKKTATQLRKLTGDGYGSDDEAFDLEFKNQLNQELDVPAASYAAGRIANVTARLSSRKAVDAGASGPAAGGPVE